MRIYLIGMPGSGKSTLGKKLAKTLGFTFIDLDDWIEQAEGIPIRDIFAQQGEAYFRKLESDVLKKTVHENDIIVATGGGTPCFFDNIRTMNELGSSIFLDVPLEKLIYRLSSGKAQIQIRPLFAGKNKEEIMKTLQDMWQKRADFYKQASVTISDKELNVDEVLKHIQKIRLS